MQGRLSSAAERRPWTACIRHTVNPLLVFPHSPLRTRSDSRTSAEPKRRFLHRGGMVAELFDVSQMDLPTEPLDRSHSLRRIGLGCSARHAPTNLEICRAFSGLPIG